MDTAATTRASTHPRRSPAHAAAALAAVPGLAALLGAGQEHGYVLEDQLDHLFAGRAASPVASPTRCTCAARQP